MTEAHPESLSPDEYVAALLSTVEKQGHADGVDA
jgi:hypothetical protein